jgi:hypothetical protein
MNYSIISSVTVNACYERQQADVRPGIMNNYEFPRDGKLVLSQLVRWVVLKP